MNMVCLANLVLTCVLKLLWIKVWLGHVPENIQLIDKIVYLLLVFAGDFGVFQAVWFALFNNEEPLSVVFIVKSIYINVGR